MTRPNASRPVPARDGGHPQGQEDDSFRRVVDLERYPIHRRAASATAQAIRTAREELSADGCAVLRGFLQHEMLASIDREALYGLAHYNDLRTNPYSSPGDPALPAGHPVNTFLERTNAFVAKADVGQGDPLRGLYHSCRFREFVTACLGEGTIHEYADPFAGFVYNVLRPGGQHPWHYDTNEFIVSTLVDPAEEGGMFEYCPRLRTPEDERFDAVSDVLSGQDVGPVKRVILCPGDLQLFYGRHSLHRVTHNEGGTPRLSAIFAYARMPGVVGRVERTRRLFGRVAPEHEAAERAATRHRADRLRD